ncbi:aldehyde dehydrogenase family protein [Micromonospora sp. NPDC005161]
MAQRRSWSYEHELHSRSLIGGEWADGGGVEFERPNPANGETLSFGRLATLSELERAIAAAKAATTAWARMPFHSRSEVLVRAADAFDAREAEVAELMTLEQGKPLAESLTETRRSASILRYFASSADRRSGDLYESPRPNEYTRVVYPPRGVVGLITPWNFPASIPVWKLAPALVYGNTVVWKPAGVVPALSVAIAQILVDAGLPEGVLNLVHADPPVAEQLVRHPDVKAVSFTGSTAVGSVIIAAAARTRTPVQAEMGGKNVTIVLDDADLPSALDALVEGSMGSTGQRCTASERLLVHSRIADELLGRLAERVNALRVGDGIAPETQVGPVATAQAKESINAAYRAAYDSGARPVAAAPVDEASPGYFVAPTVLEVANTAMPIWRDEVFGPVLAARRFDTFDEAVALANDTDYGLTAALFTDRHSYAARAATELHVGVLHLNSASIGADPHVPFGGTGASGYGPKEQGEAARDFYTESRTIYEKWVSASE